MALVFRCPACGNTIQVADEHSGLMVACPFCHQAITAPRPGESFAAPVGMSMSPPTEMSFRPLPLDGEKKGLAVAALVLGILGFCLPPLGLVGLILGIVALAKAGSRREVYGGRGLAIGGIVTGSLSGVVVLLMISIMLPALARARELAKRTTCSANMSGIGKGLHVYASDNSQIWPVAAHWPEKSATATGQVNYVGRIGSKRGKAGNPSAGESQPVDGPDGKELSTTRNLWTLIRMGGSTPGSFICPSSDDQRNDEDSPQDYWDFGVGDNVTAGPVSSAVNSEGYKQCSYGYQVPYGRLGQPSALDDPRMVLAADKGPYGLAGEGAGQAPPSSPPARLSTKSSPDDWRPWNSPNHGGAGDGEGQNSLFADAHVDWHNKPLAGLKNDNIYTQWSQPGGGEPQRVLGNGPGRSAPNLTPQEVIDTLIYP